MTDTYRDIGYEATEIGFGERPGILVVDLQIGFTDPRFPLGGRPLVRRAVDNAARVLAAARRANLPVANCYTAYGSERDKPYWKIGPVRESFYEGDPCTEMEPRTADADYDYILRKSAPSIFFQTPVASFLTRNRVDTTIVMGCMTSGCIRASVVDSFSNGYRTMVPEDCVGDAEEGPHRDNLRDVGRRYADIVSAGRVLDYIEEIRKRNA